MASAAKARKTSAKASNKSEAKDKNGKKTKALKAKPKSSSEKSAVKSKKKDLKTKAKASPAQPKAKVKGSVHSSKATKDKALKVGSKIEEKVTSPAVSKPALTSNAAVKSKAAAKSATAEKTKIKKVKTIAVPESSSVDKVPQEKKSQSPDRDSLKNKSDTGASVNKPAKFEPPIKSTLALFNEDDDEQDERPVEKPKSVKSRFSTRDLQRIRDQLVSMLRDHEHNIENDVQVAGNRDLAQIQDDSDIAAEATEGELALRHAESVAVEANEIRRAIEKIDEGTYGYCDVTGRPINEERLKFLPWAVKCVDVQAKHELRRKSMGLVELEDLDVGDDPRDND